MQGKWIFFRIFSLKNRNATCNIQFEMYILHHVGFSDRKLCLYTVLKHLKRSGFYL